MATNRNAVRAGIFILAAALVSLAVVIVISGPERFTPKRDYVALFDISENLQGIRAGDEVRLGGLRVGTVKTVDISENSDPPKMIVTITLPKRYTLKQGATVSVEALIGSASLNIDSLGTGAALGDHDTIDGLPSALTRLGAIAPKIEAMVEDVRARTIPKVDAAIDEYRLLAADARQKVLPQVASAADQGEAIAKHLKEQIGKMLDSYYAIADEAKTALKNVGDFMGPSTGPATLDFKQTLANLKDSTGSLKKDLPEITARAKTVLDQLNDRLTQLKSTADDLKSTIANTKNATATVDSLLTDNRSKIERMLASLEGTTANAKLFTAEVLRRPSRLIWKDDEKTQSNLGTYFSAREFAQGAQDLNDAAASLKDALKDPRVTDEELKRRMDLLNGTFSRFNQVEEKLWKSVKE